MGRLPHIRRWSSFEWVFVLLAAGVAMGAAETVHAAPQFSGSLNNHGVLQSEGPALDPVSLDGDVRSIDEDPSANAIGQKISLGGMDAGYGLLQGTTTASYINVSTSFPIFSGSATGAQSGTSFLIDDLVITGPPGNFLISFNYTVSGGATATAGTTTTVYSAGEARASMQIQSSFGGGGVDLGYLGVDSSGFHSATGIFSAFSSSGEFRGRARSS